jgi:uncharacterized membrane protein YdjX (TVP38/TMEM64 family)
LALGLGVLVLGAAWLLRSRFGLNLDPASFREAVLGFGVWGPILCVALVTFRALIGIPSPILLIGAGLAFGAGMGAVYGALGITISGGLYFAGARFAGREFVASRVPERMRPAFDAAGRQLGAAFLGVATGYPFGPMTAFHTFAGLTEMSALAFLAAVACGSLVRAFTYTFFGSRLVEGGAAAIALGVGVIVLAVAAPLCFPRSRRWARQMLRVGRGAAGPASGAGRSRPSPP